MRRRRKRRKRRRKRRMGRSLIGRREKCDKRSRESGRSLKS
jgi:hypothetical protein